MVINMNFLKTTLFTIVTLGALAVSGQAYTWEIEPTFEYPSQFSEGMANISLYSTVINRKGESIYQFPESAPRWINACSEGVMIGNNSKTGSSLSYLVMDRKGDMSEVNDFSKVSDFSCGMALVSNSDRNKYGYINKDLELMIPTIYTAAKDFSEGYAAVRTKDGSWKYINRDGTVVIDSEFRDAKSFSDGLAAVKNQEGLWGYIDYFGEYILNPRYNDASDFSDDVSVISDSSGIGLLKKDCSVVYLDNTIESVSQFNNGVAVAKTQSGYGLIGKNGNIIINCTMNYMSACSEGVITATKDGNSYIFNNNGEIIEEINVCEIRGSSENLINAQITKPDNTNAWGYIRNPLAIPSGWAVNTIDDMFDMGLMVDSLSYNYNSNITRGEFCDALVKAIEKRTNTILPIQKLIVFNDTYDVNISKLANEGIVDGISETEFAPDEYITREQAAKIFMATGEKYNIINNDELNCKYVDDADISAWAYDAVYKMQSNGIMQGYEDGGFRPYIKLTKEQAVAMIYRFINKLKI